MQILRFPKIIFCLSCIICLGLLYLKSRRISIYLTASFFERMPPQPNHKNPTVLGQGGSIIAKWSPQQVFPLLPSIQRQWLPSISEHYTKPKLFSHKAILISCKRPRLKKNILYDLVLVATCLNMIQDQKIANHFQID